MTAEKNNSMYYVCISLLISFAFFLCCQRWQGKIYCMVNNKEINKFSFMTAYKLCQLLIYLIKKKLVKKF